MTTKPAPFLVEKKEPTKRPVRYRATLTIPAGAGAEAPGEDSSMKSDLCKTEKAATADLLDMLSAAGLFTVVAVPVKRKQHTTYEEVV